VSTAVSVGNLTGFEFQLANAPDFIALLWAQRTMDRALTLPFYLGEGGKYYWRVRAFDVAGTTSTFSDVSTVFIDTFPPIGNSFTAFTSTGLAVPEGTLIDLASGVTPN